VSASFPFFAEIFCPLPKITIDFVVTNVLQLEVPTTNIVKYRHKVRSFVGANFLLLMTVTYYSKSLESCQAPFKSFFQKNFLRRNFRKDDVIWMAESEAEYYAKAKAVKDRLVKIKKPPQG